MKAILVRETGGPEKMLFEEVPVPTPGKGQALVQVRPPSAERQML